MGVAVVLGHQGVGVGGDGGVVVVLVVPCTLALRVWWSWHGVDVCGWHGGRLGCRVRMLRYGGGGRRWWGRCCWCAPGVWTLGGAVWLDPGLGRGVAPCWRARWPAP